MGGLIQTRGTRRLIKHYNQLFNRATLHATRTTIINDAVLSAIFTTPARMSRPIVDITNHNPGVFLPPAHHDHPNLLRRWDFYLRTELTPQNQELLRGYLAQALNLQSGVNGATGTNAKGDNYAAIHFDCIEAKPPQTQIVLQSDEYKLKGANDDDDTGLLRNTAYSMIVLVTAPISNAAPVPPDNQNIQ